MAVTRDFFDVVGVRPIIGRTFTAAEASRPGAPGKPGAPPTAILLGYDLWQREFGGDPGDRRQGGDAQPDARAAARSSA